MSSERQRDSEDADESQDRPDTGGVSDTKQDPHIDESDEGDNIASRVCPSPPASSEDRPERSAGSPVPEEGEARCTPPPAAPQTGSGGSSGGSLFSWLQNRTARRGLFVDPARDNFRTMTSLYCSMNPAVDSVNLSTQTHGAVFNLEYSPDGGSCGNCNHVHRS